MSALSQLPPSPGAGLVHVVVESPRGATSKIKYDEDLEMFTVSRPLPLGLSYPHDWGFVPGTRAEDGDPLDALVLSEGTTFPGMVLRARPIAVVKLEQDPKPSGGPRKREQARERNDRLVAVLDNAPRTEYQQPRDLPDRVREEIEHFFVDVTFFEHKHARVLGWDGPRAALALVNSTRTGRRKRGRG
jgi:inorganic pyrophosphatase